MTGSALVAAVQALYEAHPYPRYPLLARPRWQDGYLTHSRFAARLAADLHGVAPAPPNAAASGGHVTVLIGGGGEILPYVVRRWEPAGRAVVSVDLSARSLRRARLRLLTVPKSTRFHHGDLDAYLRRSPPGAFTHADAYGVLHHMPDPAATLTALAGALVAGGTARLMLYNGEARAWIRELQRCFALLRLDPLKAGDLRRATAFLTLAGRELPPLGARLAQLGPGTLANPARFADTFLHPRETRLGVAAWLARIEAAGFLVLGLLDRYAELDELPNPLWQPPLAGTLAPRAADRRFENNLELLLLRPGGIGVSRHAEATGRARVLPGLTLRLKAPPRLWFDFAETRTLPLAVRLRLWHAHLDWTLAGRRRDTGTLLRSLPAGAAQRLARLGALLPGQVADPGLRAMLAAPLADAMEPPPATTPRPATAVLRGTVRDLLSVQGRLDPRRVGAVLARLERAQR